MNMVPLFIPIPVNTGGSTVQFPRYYTYQPLQTTVVMGNLPDDFLRIPLNMPLSQEEQDRLTAIHLQNKYMGVRAVSAGRLEITFINAVLNKNYGLTRMDPYLRLRVGNHVYETHTVPNGARNPHWNKTFQVYHIPQGLEKIHVEIYDERTISDDELIAWGEIPVAEKVFKGEVVDEWYTLSGKLGEGKEGVIHAIITYNKRPVVQNPQMMFIPGATGVTPVYTLPGPAVQQQPPQPQRPAPVEIKEEDIKQVKEIFPETEDSVIQSVLEAYNGDKDAAISSLLQMQNS